MKKLVIMAAMLGMAAGAQAQARFWVDEFSAPNPTHNFTNSSSWWDGGTGFGYAAGYQLIIQDDVTGVPLPNGPVIDTDITAGFTTFFGSTDIGAHPEFAGAVPPNPVGGQLTINNGGVLGSTNLVMGAAGGSSGVLDMSGNAAMYTLYNKVNSGVGTVNMSGSSTFTTFVDTDVGAGAGDVATLNVNLSDTATFAAGTLRAGNTAADGTVNINGGAVTATDAFSGVNGGQGAINVGATGSLGASGTIYSGHAAGSVGTLTIDGAASAGGNVIAGHAGGSGTIDVNGSVNVGVSLYAGIHAGSSGTVNINNGGTATVTGDTLVGWADSSGTLNVNAGGTLNSTTLLVDKGNANISGNVNVTGSAVTQPGGTGNINVKNGGNLGAGGNVETHGAAINVEAGGNMTAGAGILAHSGDVNVYGTASSVGDTVTVAGGAGAINVKNGGHLTSGANAISYGAAINVEQGGTLTTTSGLLAGNGAGATGLINIDGTVNTLGWDFIAGWNQSSGTINVGATGVVNANGKALLAASYANAVGNINIAGTVNSDVGYAGFNGAGAVGTVTVNAAGLLDVVGNFHLGQGNAVDGYASGVLNVDGGTVVVGGLIANAYSLNDNGTPGDPGDDFWEWAGGDSQVNINSGELWIDNDLAITGFQEHGNIDLEIGAYMYIKGDNLGGMGWYEGIGALTAVDGTGTIMMDYDNVTTGYTTIWAIPEPATISLLGFAGIVGWIRKRLMI